MQDDRRVTAWLGLAMLGILLIPAVADAQDQTNKNFVRALFFQGIVDSQESPALVQEIANASADEISKFVAAAISTAPVVSSSAGFTYVRDQKTGELSLRSQSFGPSFAERPLTNGKGVGSFGVSYQHSRTAFDGAFGTADGKDEGLPIFDNTATFTSDRFVQYITKRAFLETKSDTFNFLGVYGVTDRFDIGVSVPLIWMKVEGRTEEAFDLSRAWNAGEINRAERPTPTGIQIAAQQTSLDANGIGDVQVHLKYAVVNAGADGVAVHADVRFPTGDEDELLGIGETSAKFLISASKTQSKLSFHANGGYTVGGLSDEVNYVAGVDAALNQLTASFSFLGRTLRQAALPTRVPTVRRTVTNIAGPRDIVVDRFIWSEEQVSLLQVAAGVKVHVGGNFLLNAGVLLPVNERGFQAGVTPAIGLERSWGQ
jgi:hypothetical protein